jgi:hypothetical protein
VLEEAGEAGAALRVVLRADVIANVHESERRAPFRMGTTCLA